MKPHTYQHKTRRKTCRNGASSVEFAMMAPIFFIMVFGCFAFGRIMIIEAFVEEAAFRAARHVAVIGAVDDEAVQVATDHMALVGISNATVNVIPISGGVVQTEINFDTDSIEVTVNAPLSTMVFDSLFQNFAIEKSVKVNSERIGF